MYRKIISSVIALQNIVSTLELQYLLDDLSLETYLQLLLSSLNAKNNRVTFSNLAITCFFLIMFITYKLFSNIITLIVLWKKLANFYVKLTYRNRSLLMLELGDQLDLLIRRY
jgi:hypothetical protein